MIPNGDEALRMARQRGHLLPSIPMPIPYGAHVVEDGVQFTLFSRHARRVWLMLFQNPDDARPTQEFELLPEKNRIGDLWHIHVRDARPGQFYLYRLEGAADPGKPSLFNPDQWILDPYALAISGSPKWGEVYHIEPGQKIINGPGFPKGVIVRDDFDWSMDRTLRIPLSESVIYEAHLRSFTADGSSGVEFPGTYRGFKEKIPHLQNLGVTAVEFLPLQEFNEMEFYLENVCRKDLKNLWGYSTLAFFAPNGRYATRCTYGEQVAEFKDLVLALHRAGIEVILDVVFNHTAEGDPRGQTYSFRGLDNDVFYMTDPKGNYVNYSGCGNTLNSNHPIVRDFIMQCLRYWVLHMHVDGFRFDLASVLIRDVDGELLPNPPIVEHIAEDPALRDTKIIAEAWDAAGAYHVGSFPSERWSEWNGRFRDDVRRFWRGETGTLGALATRITGSSDLYEKDDQTPIKSINFVTCHDGFSLRDLLSYASKHNEANKEENRDGDNNNHSRNYGCEGPSDNPAIAAVRARQHKNLLATVFLSQGVPMLLAGDEFGRTQRGNNNAYCQDNEISWIDWRLLDQNKSLLDFVIELIAFRKKHPCLRRLRFFTGKDAGNGLPDIQWFGPHGLALDWKKGLSVGCVINGKGGKTGREPDDDFLYMIFNADEKPVKMTLPKAPAQPWALALTTQETQPDLQPSADHITIDARSVNVLVSALSDAPRV